MNPLEHAKPMPLPPIGINEPVDMYAKSMKKGLRFKPNPTAEELPSTPPTEKPIRKGSALNKPASHPNDNSGVPETRPWFFNPCL